MRRTVGTMLSTGARRIPRDHRNHCWRPLLDHLVGGGEERFRDDEAEHLGGLQIYDKFEFGGLKDGRLGTFQDTADILTSSDQVVGTARTVSEQPPGLGIFAIFEHRRKSVLKSERHDPLAQAKEKPIGDE